MTAITALFLDVGGVLLTNGWDTALRTLAAETFHLDLKEMDSRHHLTFDTYECGKLSLDEYLNRVVFYQPRMFSKEQFKQFMFDHAREYPEMIALVKELKSRFNLKVAVVSNEGRELTEHRISKFALKEFVDYFVVSSFVHLRKPDEDIFKMALNLSQAHPHQVAYVDDRQMFVEVASQLGIKGIHHTSAASTKEALLELLQS